MSGGPATPAVWEPWVPAVGDSVRIRLSAECRLDRGFPPLGHDDTFDGQVGDVLSVDRPEAIVALWSQGVEWMDRLGAHRFGVRIQVDDEDEYEWFAALELEPLPALSRSQDLP